MAIEMTGHESCGIIMFRSDQTVHNVTAR